jgi:hypothetical protein
MLRDEARSAKADTVFSQSWTQRRRLDFQAIFLGLDARQVEQVVDELAQASAVAFDDVDELDCGLGVVSMAMRRVSAAERTDATGVRSSCDTLATKSRRTVSSRRISVTSNSTRTRARGSPESRAACTRRRRGLMPPTSISPTPDRLAEGLLDDGLQLGVADDLDGRASGHVRVEQQHFAQRRIGQQDAVLAVHDQDAFAHGLEDAAQKIAVIAQLAHRARRLAAR